MNFSKTEISVPKVQLVTITEDTLTVALSDGRTILVPLLWFPRLVYGTLEERHNWQVIGAGYGIHWPDLDEDISVEGLLAGRPSGESQSSLKQWLEQRQTAATTPKRNTKTTVHTKVKASSSRKPILGHERA